MIDGNPNLLAFKDGHCRGLHQLESSRNKKDQQNHVKYFNQLIYTYMLVYIYIHMLIFMLICIYRCIYIYKDTKICIYISTYIVCYIDTSNRRPHSSPRSFLAEKRIRSAGSRHAGDARILKEVHQSWGDGFSSLLERHSAADFMGFQWENPEKIYENGDIPSGKQAHFAN